MFAAPVTSRSILLSILLGILVLTAVVYWPVLDNDFVNFDDTKYLISNPYIKDISPAVVKDIFTGLRGLQYHYVPLSLLSFAVEYTFFKLDPRIYHLDNLILHVLNTALVFIFIWLLARHWLLAAVGAVLFGIHPMHVESVAWIAERKDVLYTVFFMTGLICYLLYVWSKAQRYLWFTLFSFILSCLSKPMAMTFPLSLLCLDYYFQRLKNLSTYTEKIPFFAVSFLFAFLTSAGKYFPMIEFDEGFTWGERFLIANYTFLQYVTKAFFPVHLSTFYPYPIRTASTLLPDIYFWAPVLSILSVVMFIYWFRHSRLIIFGGLFFFVNIFLVLNFYPLGNMLMADRYGYVSFIGLFLVLGKLLCLLFEHPFSRNFKVAVAIVSLGYIALLSIRTYQRVDVWQNSETMWNDAILKYPREPFLYYNLADYYFRQGKWSLALQEYNNCLTVDPRYFAAYNNRGNMYIMLGNYELALRDYLEAVEINPRFATAFLNLGRYYMFLKQYDKATAAYDKLLSLDPGDHVVKEERAKARNLLENVRDSN